MNAVRVPIGENQVLNQVRSRQQVNSHVSETDPDQLLNVQQARRLLNIGRSKLLELVESGQIPVVRIGSRMLFRRHTLLTWTSELEARQSQTA